MLATRLAAVVAVRRVLVLVALGSAVAISAFALRSQPEPEYVPGCTILPVKPEPALEVLSIDPEPAHPTCSCTPTVNGKLSVEQHRTLELACRLYSDEDCRHEFVLFATPKSGSKTAVIVKRSTGDCGGCGALAVTAVFDHGTLEAIGELGRFGRFGNGPDAAAWVDVAGEPALEITSSTSMGGYSYEYREYFLRDGDGFKCALCITTAADDRGAHDKPYDWKARLHHRDDGAIDIRYTAIQRSKEMPNMTPVTIGYDRANRRWLNGRSDDRCVVPFNPHDI